MRFLPFTLPTLPRFTRMPWRQQSLLVSMGGSFVALALVLGVIGLWHFSQLPFRNWFSFTFVPFVIVVLLGGMARAQHRIDVRAGRLATLEGKDES